MNQIPNNNYDTQNFPNKFITSEDTSRLQKTIDRKKNSKINFILNKATFGIFKLIANNMYYKGLVNNDFKKMNRALELGANYKINSIATKLLKTNQIESLKTHIEINFPHNLSISDCSKLMKKIETALIKNNQEGKSNDDLINLWLEFNGKISNSLILIKNNGIKFNSIDETNDAITKLVSDSNSKISSEGYTSLIKIKETILKSNKDPKVSFKAIISSIIGNDQLNLNEKCILLNSNNLIKYASLIEIIKSDVEDKDKDKDDLVKELSINPESTTFNHSELSQIIRELINSAGETKHAPTVIDNLINNNTLTMNHYRNITKSNKILENLSVESFKKVLNQENYNKEETLRLYQVAISRCERSDEEKTKITNLSEATCASSIKLMITALEQKNIPFLKALIQGYPKQKQPHHLVFSAVYYAGLLRGTEDLDSLFEGLPTDIKLKPVFIELATGKFQNESNIQNLHDQIRNSIIHGGRLSIAGKQQALEALTLLYKKPSRQITDIINSIDGLKIYTTEDKKKSKETVIKFNESELFNKLDQEFDNN